jgi:hypothetical protein
MNVPTHTLAIRRTRRDIRDTHASNRSSPSTLSFSSTA